jgi:hypothetical protein
MRVWIWAACDVKEENKRCHRMLAVDGGVIRSIRGSPWIWRMADKMNRSSVCEERIQKTEFVREEECISCWPCCLGVADMARR